jgi:hypothetical protein
MTTDRFTPPDFSMKISVSNISVNLGGTRFLLKPEQAVRLRDELTEAIESDVHTLLGMTVVDVGTVAFNDSVGVVFSQGESGMTAALVVRL